MQVAGSPDFLQSVIDHPAVRRWVAPDGADGPLPLALVFDQGIGLEFDTGGFFFHRLGDGVYEVHTLFLPKSRDVMGCAMASAHFMFCATDCTRILTKVPDDNIAARRLTERMLFRHDYTLPCAFVRGGKAHDVRHYALDFDDWGRNRPRWVFDQCRQMGQPEKGERFLYRRAVFDNDYTLLEK